MAETLTIRTASSTEIVKIAVPGPQGPKGDKGDPGDVAGLPLTTQGDTLYRGASQNERLAIGTTGQILKVSAQGLPTWANESGGVTSVNGATGAVTVAAATHAVEHEAGEADEIQAMAALVETDYLPLNGVYFWDGTTTSGRPNFFKTGTRKNTKIVYNSATGEWNLVRNNVVESIGVDGSVSVPWDTTWGDFVTPTTVTVTRLPLETMVQKLAETGGAATATTSEDGLMSSSDKTKLNGIAAGAEVNVQSNWTEADTASDAFIQNKPSTFAPSAHSSSHSVLGSDPLAPSDIGAQSLFTNSSQVVSADVTLTAGRATKWSLENYNGATYNITLPTSSNQAGDVVIVTTGTLVGSQIIRKLNFGSNYTTLATLAEGQSYRFLNSNGASGGWAIDPVYTHEHTASAITSGTLTHERGGLEADVSAYSGLVKISGGSTSAVTVTSAGEALLDDADAAAQRTTLGLGTAAVEAASAFAQASHTHELTALAATGATNGHVLTANGSNGVTFSALPASGVSSVSSSASDVLGVSGANITGVDAGSADRIVFWDDSASKLTYLEAGSGLSISGTTLSATGGLNAMQSIAINFVLN